jgi:antitoxin component HigA of HigAB toxin-antitoxin module
MSRVRKSPEQLQRECDRFNQRCAVGAPVVVTRDNGDQFRSTTTTHAQVLGSHSAVIWVQDGRSCLLLDRVEPAISA